MFGYVLPARERLTEEQQAGFQSMYCGLCHTLREEYGFAASLILNYDLTFLAVLLSPGDAPASRCRRCAAHPCQGRCAAEKTAALKKAAACSVILAWWQVQDGVADSRGIKRLKYRLAALALRRAYRRAEKDCPAFDGETRAQLAALAALERSRCDTLDEPADAFARLLAGVAAELDDPVQRRVYRELLYHMGRWIYLVDAADDLHRDWESGNYNPVALRYGLSDGTFTDESKAAFSGTLDLSVRQMAAAFELWDFGCWTALLRSTFYEGLYQVGNAVLAGTFHPRKRRGQAERKQTEDRL